MVENDTDKTIPEIHNARIKKTRVSPIWLLPVLALIVGGWLIFKGIFDAPTSITIQFDNGVGIEPEKTPVKYNGINVGIVSDIYVNKKDMESVIAKVNISKSFVDILKDDTQFWLVKPEFSITQISGLGTLITGNYISMRFTDKETNHTKRFIALTNAPEKIDSGSLVIKLIADYSRSMKPGENIIYKGIVVGNVLNVRLSNTANEVLINIVIHKRYVPLVRENSVFWDASGIKFHVGLFSGAELTTSSLQNIIQGGVSFATPDKDMGDKVKAGHSFKVHQESKKDWLKWSPTIELDSSSPAE